jgi:hypothetical protein
MVPQGEGFSQKFLIHYGHEQFKAPELQNRRMIRDQRNLRLATYGFFVLASLVIIMDFSLPGEENTRQIIEVQKERQNYYNAGGNYHYSHKVITDSHQFHVEEDFAPRALESDKINYAVSPLFIEVNWYRLHPTDKRSFHSLRLASGLILPLLLILAVVITLKWKKRLGTVVFVLQALMIGNLIWLMI